jgi:glutamate-1-semialdehyde aminotransferase
MLAVAEEAVAAVEVAAVVEVAAILRLEGMMIRRRRHRRNRLESVLSPLLSKKGMVSSWPLCASMFSPHITRLAPTDFQFVENWRDFHVNARCSRRDIALIHFVLGTKKEQLNSNT